MMLLRIKEIGEYIRDHFHSFSAQDNIIFDSSVISCDPVLFIPISSPALGKSIAFIDGGQADVLSSGNFCLSFLRVAAIIMQGNQKRKIIKKEFYLFTKAVWKENDIFYESSLFPLESGNESGTESKNGLEQESDKNTAKLIDEGDLFISSTDSSLRIGKERAPITRIASMARRFAELALAATISADFILLDGTLEATFKNEEKYLARLPSHTAALAKTCSLFTQQGNNPVTLLNQRGPLSCWSYHLKDKTHFVKLHPSAKHIFRFEGKVDVLGHLIENSSDAIFLGYPYGLILADQFARVSNAEKNSMKMQFLLREENKEIIKYLQSTNAHEILDSLG